MDIVAVIGTTMVAVLAGAGVGRAPAVAPQRQKKLPHGVINHET